MANRNYSTEEKEEIIENIMFDSYDSKSNQATGSVEDISKFVFEKYSNASLGKLKMFFYSTGSQNNNHPYMYKRQMSIKKFALIVELHDSLVHGKDDDGLDDLLLDEVDKEIRRSGDGY